MKTLYKFECFKKGCNAVPKFFFKDLGVYCCGSHLYFTITKISEKAEPNTNIRVTAINVEETVDFKTKKSKDVYFYVNDKKGKKKRVSFRARW